MYDFISGCNIYPCSNSACKKLKRYKIDHLFCKYCQPVKYRLRLPFPKSETLRRHKRVQSLQSRKRSTPSSRLEDGQAAPCRTLNTWLILQTSPATSPGPVRLLCPLTSPSRTIITPTSVGQPCNAFSQSPVSKGPLSTYLRVPYIQPGSSVDQREEVASPVSPLLITTSADLSRSTPVSTLPFSLEADSEVSDP